MPKIYKFSTITVAPNQKIVIQGSASQATVTVNPGSMGQIYDVGNGQDVFGPYDRATRMDIEVRSGSVDYDFIAEPRAIKTPNGPLTVVVDGDSFAANGFLLDSTKHLWSTRGWWVHALNYIKGNLRLVNMGGVGGHTAQQILARFDSTVAQFAPNEVWAIIGQNNLPASDGGAAAIAAIQQYVQRCIGLGITLRLGTVTPRHGANQTATIQANVIAINEAIREMAAAGLCKVFDSHAVMVDPASATGAALTGSTYDEGTFGLHPNAKFCQRIAREFARTFAGEFEQINIRPSSTTDSRQVIASSKQLVLNPKMSGAGAAAGTGASGTEPTSWPISRRQGSNITVVGAGNQTEVDIAAAIAGTADATYDATEQGLLNSAVALANTLRQAAVGNTGNYGRTWIKMTAGGTASGTEIIGIQQSNVALASMLAPVKAGDRVESARISARTVGLSSNFKSLTMRVEALNGSTPLFTVEGFNDTADTQGEMPDSEFVIECPGFVIPENTTRLRVTVQASFVSGACAGDIFLTDCAIYLA